MKANELELELSESEKQELRLWCMREIKSRMYEMYEWLINSNSIEELELKQKVYFLGNRNFQAGTFQEQYQWIITGVIPTIAIETFIELPQS